MQKKYVTLIALAALVAVATLAYLFVNRGPSLDPSGAQASAGKAVDAASAPLTTSKKADTGKAAASKGDAASKGFGGPPPVEVIELKPTKVSEELQAVGTLRSNESVMLRPEVSGRIASINFRDGQPVKRGQLLIALDAALNVAEVAQARAELELAQNQWKRTEDLARKNFVSSSAMDQAASNVEVLAAKLKVAEARLAKMNITAPFDGVAGIRSVSVGDYVKDGADLVNIEDIQTLKADFRLPERHIGQLRVGQAIELEADARPGEHFRGTIDAINPHIDVNGRSLEVRARLVNPQSRLRPGMFSRVRVILGERTNALLVPEEAIVPMGDEFYVFTVVDGTARRVRVKLGVRRAAHVEILEGVRAGDRVVTAGIRVQRDGQPVRVIGESSSVERPASSVYANAGDVAVYAGR
jgi:membrane fusion protein (multidrug efflux system)